jgi:uncharacterized protein
MAEFTSPSHVALHALCDSQALAGVLHPYAFIQGLIFAVAGAPEIPMPEKWLPWAIKTNNQLTSSKQADQITDLLMVLLQQQLKDMSDEKVCLPAGTRYEPNHGPDGALSLWCQGSLYGHRYLESVWQDAWNKMQITEKTQLGSLQKDLAHCLHMFSTFADIPLAIEQAKTRGNANFLPLLPKIFLSFEASMITYVGLSGRLVDFLPNQFETFASEIK